MILLKSNLQLKQSVLLHSTSELVWSCLVKLSLNSLWLLISLILLPRLFQLPNILYIVVPISSLFGCRTQFFIDLKEKLGSLMLSINICCMALGRLLLWNLWVIWALSFLNMFSTLVIPLYWKNLLVWVLYFALNTALNAFFLKAQTFL